jgi:uncharacterized tellurite resistance protein B-like protein
MLKALNDLVTRALGSVAADAEGAREHGIELATALLLVEVARADYDEDLTEDEAVAELLRDRFDLSDAELALLVEEARAKADHAASLQSFTRELHEKLTLEEKHRVIEMLWEVAYADSRLDKHEDHLVRKIGGLLYISHSDLIRIRNSVLDRNA